MSDIVDAGCQLLIWLGLLDVSTCVRSPGSQSVLWLKMIAGPTLIITILILVLFEDMYFRPKIRLPSDTESQPLPSKPRRRYQGRRLGYSIQVENAEDREKPLLEREKIRLVICDKSADQNKICYRLLKACPLKELIQFHYRSLGRELADEGAYQYILRRLESKVDSAEQQQSSKEANNGPLNIDKAPRQIGLRDLDRLEIQLDYKSLYESFSNVLWRTRMRFTGELEQELSKNRHLSEQSRTLSEKLDQHLAQQSLLTKTIEDQKLEIHHLQEYRNAAKEAKANAARIEVLYTLESSSRSRVEKELQSLQHQLLQARTKLYQSQSDSEQELSSKAALLDQMKLNLESVEGDRNRLLDKIVSLKADRDRTLKVLGVKKEEMKAVIKQLSETQALNEKITTELNELRLSVKALESSNSNLQLQLHEHLHRKDGEIRPGALICRPIKKTTNAFESNSPASDWIRSPSRTLPGIQAPLLIIDDGGTQADEVRPFRALDRADWRYS